MKKSLLIILTVSLLSGCDVHKTELVENPADYVSTLVGTLSEHSFSTGNTYPATAVPWGMNFWTPVTGKMGDGWAYRYDAHQIRGFEQTHQPSPWINDYGQFTIMPVTGRPVFSLMREPAGSLIRLKRRDHITMVYISLTMMYMSN